MVPKSDVISDVVSNLGIFNREKNNLVEHIALSNSNIFRMSHVPFNYLLKKLILQRGDPPLNYEILIAHHL